MIKAIETHYKGYKFRSRLEARWAVFFDSLGLDWEYESEGFDLDGVYYLPDFLISLNGIDCFVEIKPVYPNKEELNKGKALAYTTRKPFYFLTTTPNPEIFHYPDCHILDYWAFIPANRLDKYAGIDSLNYWFDFTKDTEAFSKAAAAARSARFEHGHSGATD